MSDKKTAYLQFLKTPDWNLLRRECYQMANWTCARCGKRDCELHAHHKRYPEHIEDTRQEDLECLCFDCHDYEHNPQRNLKALTKARAARKITRKEFVEFRGNLSAGVRRKGRSRRKIPKWKRRAWAAKRRHWSF